MPVSRCPACDAALLDAEAAGAACPMCATPFARPEAAPPAPPPAASSSWAMTALAWVVLLGAGGMFLYAATSRLDLFREAAPASPGTTPQPPEREPDATPSDSSEEDLARLRREVADARNLLKKEAAARAAAEAELGQAESLLAEAAERVDAAETALAELRARTGVDAEGVQHIDKADSVHYVEPLERGSVVKLAGRVGTLRVRSVNGAVLDASALSARLIVFEGPINHKSRVKVFAPSGSVSVSGVGGESEVTIDAPGGRVAINTILGNAQVKVRARDVAVSGTINGDSTEMRVTLTPVGTVAASLRLTSLLGSSRVLWKREKPGDPMPRLVPGRHASTARFAEE